MPLGDYEFLHNMPSCLSSPLPLSSHLGPADKMRNLPVRVPVNAQRPLSKELANRRTGPFPRFSIRDQRALEALVRSVSPSLFLQIVDTGLSASATIGCYVSARLVMGLTRRQPCTGAIE